MPILKEDVILQIAGNLKAFLKLEMGITRGELPASGSGSAREKDLRRAKARITQQKRQIKRLRRRSRRARGGRPGPRARDRRRFLHAGVRR